MAERPPQRRGAEALAGIVAEMLRRAAQAGFTADELASATFAAATERKRPGPHVRVLFAECTSADAGYDAERLSDEFGGTIDVEGALLDDLPERLERFHYDLVATTTFHADEAQALVAGRVPVVAMLVGPGYVELVHEIAALPAGSKVGLVCASWRGSDNIRETLTLSGTTGVEIVTALIEQPDDLELIDQTADAHPHVARGAGGRARPQVLASGPDPPVDLRLRPVRARAAPARGRARGRSSRLTSAGRVGASRLVPCFVDGPDRDVPATSTSAANRVIGMPSGVRWSACAAISWSAMSPGSAGWPTG